jgi:hypothetical protein
MVFLRWNCTRQEIRVATDQILIDSYSSAPFDYDENTYDMIAEELMERNLLEIE